MARSVNIPAQDAAGRRHQHVRAESLLSAPRAALVGEDPEDVAVHHHAPGAGEAVPPRHARALRLPARAGGVPVHGIGAEEAGVAGVSAAREGRGARARRASAARARSRVGAAIPGKDATKGAPSKPVDRVK